ncbi:outer membrane receptor protein involved in Fe transport [Mucilaginibacter gracilis]|uniref:Outer membrane receptor protein involved in Fe transport n=1 Tax=Mucilaginibacter gracilis TaxID=423350 RepID=A0A495IYI1_9SPHI|nr:outer membrane beta-barrel family protein [Mucilaginibacter gracilis]RKR81563.1 outer membrane receptor protein involved in Fe transport [Mucilaginibacter gracilis]
MKKFLTVLFCLSAFTAAAQVSGKVTDEKGDALPGAVIRLFKNNQPAKTALTDTAGYFNCNVPGLNYLVITSVGFMADTIFTTQKPLGNIKLIPATRRLNEVRVQARQPIIKQETDRSVIMVNEQVKKLADNALEIVNLAPSITISDNEDAILMSGKAEVQIMINDKPVKMTARDLAKMLKAMPAGSIKQVEILTNPPAKYEVNGNTGIINIKTNMGVKGITGNLDYSTSQSVYNWTDLSGLLNYGAGKLAVSTYGAWHSGGYLTSDVKVRKLNTGTLNQQTSNLDNWSDPVWRVAIDYAIGKKSTLGGIIEREASTNTSSYDSYLQQPSNSYQTIGSNPYVRYWNTYNLNYRYSDTLGTELTVDLDRADFTKNGHITVITTGQPQLNYETLTNISINTLKTDYSHAWKNKLKLEAGFKIAAVQTNNNQDANQFNYHENIRAAYTALSGSAARWGWQFGLRAEQTTAKGESELASSAKLTRPDTSYFNLLPSAYFTYAPGAKHHLRLSISRRIKRPDYNDLQPFTYVQDPLSQQTGNPNLRVQRNDEAELTYTFDDRITLVGAYSQANDYFNTIMKQAGNVLIEMPANTGTMNTLNFDLNYPVKATKWWNMLYKANLGNDHFKGALLDGELNEGKWHYQFSTSQRFTLPGKYQLQLSGRYTSASQNLIYARQDNANVSAGISRKLFKDQASVRLGVSDIFKTQRNYTSVNFGSLNYTDEGNFESRRVSFNFSWRFGNTKIRQTEERRRGDADEKGRSGS